MLNNKKLTSFKTKFKILWKPICKNCKNLKKMFKKKNKI